MALETHAHDTTFLDPSDCVSWLWPQLDPFCIVVRTEQTHEHHPCWPRPGPLAVGLVELEHRSILWPSRKNYHTISIPSSSWVECPCLRRRQYEKLRWEIKLITIKLIIQKRKMNFNCSRPRISGLEESMWVIVSDLSDIHRMTFMTFLCGICGKSDDNDHDDVSYLSRFSYSIK